MAKSELKKKITSWEDIEYNFDTLFSLLNEKIDRSALNLPDNFFLNNEEGFGVKDERGNIMLQIDADGVFISNKVGSLEGLPPDEYIKSQVGVFVERMAKLFGFKDANQMFNASKMIERIMVGRYINPEVLPMFGVDSHNLANRSVQGKHLRPTITIPVEFKIISSDDVRFVVDGAEITVSEIESRLSTLEGRMDTAESDIEDLDERVTALE